MYQNKPYYLISIMKNQLTLILITSLLTTFSLKLYAEEVTKIEINIYTNDGVESSTINTNSNSITISTDSQKTNNESSKLTNSLITEKSFDTKKQSKYYLSTGFGKIKDDVVANLSVGYQLFPNLSAEAGLITSAEVHSISSSSSTTSGTTDGKAYSITANAGLKTASNTSYLLGVNYSIPVFSNRPNTVPFPKLMPNLQINNNNLEFYSKAGVLFWGVDYSLYLDGTITFDGTTYSPNGSIPFAAAKGSNFYYGIGLSYPLTNEASIRTEYFNSKIAGIKFGGLTSSAVFKF
jgi:hypothetical protein